MTNIVNSLLEALTAASDDEQLQFANDLLRRDNNQLTQHVFRVAAERMADDDRKRKALESHYLPYKISETDLGLIQNSYPEFNVLVNDKPTLNSHALTGNTRGLDERVLVRKAGNNVTVSFGGDYTWYVRQGFRHVHSCWKLCDIRCKIRRMTQDSLLRQLVTYKKKGVRTAAEEAVAYPLRYHCLDDSKHCTFQADYAIANHSLYDYKLTDIFDSMIAHNTKFLFATVIFNFQILYDYDNVQEGSLKYNKVHYTWQTRGDVEYINFTFRNDSGLGYSHRWDTYYKLFTTNATSHRGFVFVIEMQENRLDTQYLKICKVCAPHPGIDYYFHRVWHDDAREKVLVKTFQYKYVRKPHPRKSLTIGWTPCYRTLYESVLEYCGNWDNSKLTLENVYGFLSHRNSSFLANGQVITQAFDQKIGAHDLAKLSVSIFWEANLLKYNAEQSVKVLTAAENIKRWVYTSAWYRVLFGSVLEMLDVALDFVLYPIDQLFGYEPDSQHLDAKRPTFGQSEHMRDRPRSMINYGWFRRAMAALHNCSDFEPEFVALPSYLTYDDYVRYKYQPDESFTQAYPKEPETGEDGDDLTYEEKADAYALATDRINKPFRPIDPCHYIAEYFTKDCTLTVPEFRRLRNNYADNSTRAFDLTVWSYFGDSPYEVHGESLGVDIHRHFKGAKTRIHVMAAIGTFVRDTEHYYSQVLSHIGYRFRPLDPDSIVNLLRFFFMTGKERRIFDYVQGNDMAIFTYYLRDLVLPHLHYQAPDDIFVFTSLNLLIDSGMLLSLTGPALMMYACSFAANGESTLLFYALNTFIYYFNLHYSQHGYEPRDFTAYFLSAIVNPSVPINDFDFRPLITNCDGLLDAFDDYVDASSCSPPSTPVTAACPVPLPTPAPVPVPPKVAVPDLMSFAPVGGLPTPMSPSPAVPPMPTTPPSSHSVPSVAPVASAPPLPRALIAISGLTCSGKTTYSNTFTGFTVIHQDDYFFKDKRSIPHSPPQYKKPDPTRDYECLGSVDWVKLRFDLDARLGDVIVEGHLLHQSFVWDLATTRVVVATEFDICWDRRLTGTKPVSIPYFHGHIGPSYYNSLEVSTPAHELYITADGSTVPYTFDLWDQITYPKVADEVDENPSPSDDAHPDDDLEPSDPRDPENEHVAPAASRPKLLVYAFSCSGKTTWTKSLPLCCWDTDSLVPSGSKGRRGNPIFDSPDLWTADAFTAPVVITNLTNRKVIDAYRSHGYVTLAVRIPDDLWSERYNSRLGQGSISMLLEWQKLRAFEDVPLLTGLFGTVLSEFPDIDAINRLLEASQTKMPAVESTPDARPEPQTSEPVKPEPAIREPTVTTPVPVAEATKSTPNAFIPYEYSSQGVAVYDKNLIPKTVKHGQCKLFVSFMHFIHKFNVRHVVYFGCTPGFNICTALQLVPDLVVHAYDPRQVMWQHERFHFTNAPYPVFADLPIGIDAIYSDVRSFDKTQPNYHALVQAELEAHAEIIDSCDLPVAIKFKPPYPEHADKFSFYAGEIFMQQFNSPHSTETRLYIPAGLRKRTIYDTKLYESRCFYYNTTVRDSADLPIAVAMLESVNCGTYVDQLKRMLHAEDRFYAGVWHLDQSKNLSLLRAPVPLVVKDADQDLSRFIGDATYAEHPVMQVAADLYKVTVVIYYADIDAFSAHGNYPTFILLKLAGRHYTPVVRHFEQDYSDSFRIGAFQNVAGDGACFYRAFMLAYGSIESAWNTFKAGLISGVPFVLPDPTIMTESTIRCNTFVDQQPVRDAEITALNRSLATSVDRYSLSLIDMLKNYYVDRTLILDSPTDSVAPAYFIRSSRKSIDVISQVKKPTPFSELHSSVYSVFGKVDRNYKLLAAWGGLLSGLRGRYDLVVVSPSLTYDPVITPMSVQTVCVSVKPGGDAFFLYCQPGHLRDTPVIPHLSKYFTTVSALASPFHLSLSDPVWLHCKGRNRTPFAANHNFNYRREIMGSVTLHDYWSNRELMLSKMIKVGPPEQWIKQSAPVGHSDSGTSVPFVRQKRKAVPKYKGEHPPLRNVKMNPDLKAAATARCDEFIQYNNADYINILDNIRVQVGCLGPSTVDNYPPHDHFKRLNDTQQLTILVLGPDGRYRTFRGEVTSEYDSLYDEGTRGLVKCEYSFKHKAYKVDSRSKYLYANKQFKLFQAYNFKELFSNYIPNHDATIKLMEGPPGCGKTYQCMEMAKKCNKPTAILSATRKGKEELASRLGGDCDRIFVSTVDSYMLNCKKTFHNVFVDEALMVHAAVYDYIATVSQCKNLLLFGDRRQIPFISRVPNMRLLHQLYQFDPKDVNLVTVSLRCPQDVISIIAPKYGCPIHTTNEIRKSLSVRPIKGIADAQNFDPDFLAYDPSRQYITLHQQEKHELLKKGFKDVLSVHEAQGQTFEHVVLVRTEKKSFPLFSETGSHYLVAISRHTKSFVYATEIATQTSDVYLSLDKQTIVGNLLVDNMAAKHATTRYFELVKKLTNGGGHYPAPATPDPRNDVATLQSFYDSVFPGIRTSLDNMGLDYQLEHNPLHLTLPGVKIDASKSYRGVNNYRFSTFEYLSKLMTAQPSDRPRTPKQLGVALQKRNADAPQNMAARRLCEFETRIWPRFKRYYCVPDVDKKLKHFADNPIVPNRELIEEVVSEMKQAKIASMTDPKYKGKFSNKLDVTLADLQEYEAAIKKDPKNVLEDTATYQALQVIAASSGKVNALFGGVFRELFRRFQTILRPNVYCHLKKNIDHMEDALNTFLDPAMLYKILEIDQSKYDKSQQEFAFEIERKFWKLLGLADNWADLWFEGHVDTKLVSFMLGIVFKVWYQRKSGDVTTCFGNTILNMAAIADTVDLDTALLMMFVGDDSIIYLTGDFSRTEISDSLLLGWNFQAKLIEGKGAYFCSTFHVHDGKRYVVLPDPLKRAERLGKHVLASSVANMYENFVSFGDLVKSYGNYAAIDALRADFARRYRNNSGLVQACASMFHISKDFNRYLALFRPLKDLEPGSEWINNRSSVPTSVNHKVLVVEASDSFFSSATTPKAVEKHFDSSSQRPFKFTIKSSSFSEPPVLAYPVFVLRDTLTRTYKNLGYTSFYNAVSDIQTKIPGAKFISGDIRFRY
jgi:hypothetical protein